MRGLVHASESHLADCRFRQLSPKTLLLYEQYERSFIGWCADSDRSLELVSLNGPNVKEFSQWVRTRHGGKRDGESAARTAVSVLKVWCHYCVDEDLIESDYLSRLRLPQVTRVARLPYQMWEIQALRGAMAESPTGVRDVAMLSLLLDTGLRVSELVSLRVQDVDLHARRLIVHWGKGHHERVLPFGNATSHDGGSSVRRLRAYLAARFVSPAVTGAAHDRLFMSVHGRPLTDVGVRDLFARAAKKVGLSHQEVHACRHTFAVRWLVRNPGDVEGLRYMLGHLSPEMYRVYAAQAGAIIADIAGRESVADALFAEQGITKVPVRPDVRGRHLTGVGLPRAGTSQRPGPGNPEQENQEPGRLPNPLNAGRHSTA